MAMTYLVLTKFRETILHLSKHLPENVSFFDRSAHQILVYVKIVCYRVTSNIII